jgi:hypothetical protein
MSILISPAEVRLEPIVRVKLTERNVNGAAMFTVDHFPTNL